MRFCLILLLLAAPLRPESRGVAAGAAPLVRSVIRSDARTGKLVRQLEVVRRPAPLPAEEVGQLVREAAGRHAVDPQLIHSVIRVESNYDPYAISPKGARGLMQLMPATARRFGVSNSFDPGQNIEGGAKYLKHLIELFPHDLRLALAAYNAGEQAVAKYGWIPPYTETRDYVNKVARLYSKGKQPESMAVSPPPEGSASEEPEHRPIEVFVDDQGRLHYRTR